MGKSSEYFMQIREEELLGLEHIENEYTYKDWIKNLKSPKVIAVARNSEGFMCLIQGDTPQEVYELAKEAGVTKEFDIVIPEKFIFKK
jgi:hypothetical protein